VLAADGGAECEGLYRIALKQNPKLMYMKCGQHRLHNAEKAATKAELPDLVRMIRVYNRVIRDYEDSINGILRRIQGAKQSDARTLIQVRNRWF